MKGVCLLTLGAMLAAAGAFADEAAPKGKDRGAVKLPSVKIEYFEPEEQTSSGSVMVAESRIDYQAIAGTLVVHPKGWDDSSPITDQDQGTEDQQNATRTAGAANDKNPTAEASMFYVAYFKKGAEPEARPVTFLFNGGPGSSTIWLHMGAFGPKRAHRLRRGRLVDRARCCPSRGRPR
jgi:carboxypeptidase C (cathepsin A)